MRPHMKLGAAVAGLLTGLAILVGGCGDGDSATGPDAPDFSGVWVGQTSSSRDVRMVVTGTRVDSLSITVRLSAGMGYCTGPMRLTSPVNIQGSSFSATMEFPGATFTTTATGSFSGNSVSGTYQGYSGSFSLSCGGMLIVGTGSPLSSGTFTATKQ